MKLTIGERLSDLRKENKLSQSEVADIANVSVSQISRIESGAVENVNSEMLFNLVKYYKVSADYILGLTNSRIQTNIELSKLKLSDKAIKILLNNRIDNTILNRIIEHKAFPSLINQLSSFINGSNQQSINILNGFLNNSINSIKEYKTENGISNDFDDTLNTLRANKVNANEFEIQKIQTIFKAILLDMQKNEPQTDETDVKLTENIMKNIVSEYSKSKSMNVEFTSKMLTDNVLNTIQPLVNIKSKHRKIIQKIFSLFFNNID